jgi:Primase C terminal 2 (PriCT-2)/Bifunctional DNA primase/polymerase, N-terminal
MGETRAVTSLPLGYVLRGWCAVPIPPGQKKPAMPGWQNFSAAIEDVPRLFANGENVAVRLGSRSGELVDIDLDCPEALALAGLYLPATGAEFGRPSKTRSHRLYISPGAIYEAFADPISGDMLIELRADGREGGAHLTLLPPSIADGEQRQWHGDTIVPAVVSTAALRLATAWLAIGCLVMRYIGETGARRPVPDLPRLLWEFDHELARPAYRWLGKPDPDAPQRYPRRRAELSQRDLDLAEIVAAIRNDCSWEDWNRVGMAIFAASGGSEDGFVVFDDFSSKSPKYDPHEVQKRWFNFRRSPPSRIGMGSLVYLAWQAGWRPSEQRDGAR